MLKSEANDEVGIGRRRHERRTLIAGAQLHAISEHVEDGEIAWTNQPKPMTRQKAGGHCRRILHEADGIERTLQSCRVGAK